jgi:hypothetical protein
VLVRLRAQGQEVLLAVSIRPFLSHRREDASDVILLRETLKVYGAGGWKDTEDLAIGERTREGVRRAIFEDTGGFLWWGTPSILESSFVNDVEIPAAFDRREVDPSYPIVPLFVRLRPGGDRDAIKVAVGSRAGDLLECNGLICSDGETVEAFCRTVAKRYVSDAVKAMQGGGKGGERVEAEMRALSEPTGERDLTFDWRGLIDPRARTLAPEADQRITEAVTVVRQALQGAFSAPHVLLDLDLPLPLAFLVGYEWRITARLRLTILQRTGVSYAEIHGDGKIAELDPPERMPLAGDGPAVVAVSCGDGLGEAATSYAAELGARELVTLHNPGILDAAEIRALARATARVLRDLSNRGVEKHLIMLGPEALAVFAGAALNASGRIVVPFWNGVRYVEPIVVGV